MYQDNIVNKEYQDNNKDDLECPIHSDILINPMLCQNADCEQIYCKSCVDELPKSENDHPKCPNCQESTGFDVLGTKSIRRKLDNLKIKCINCKEIHSQSTAVCCTKKQCNNCLRFFDEKLAHCCFKCWRCKNQFKDINKMKEHVENCSPLSDNPLFIQQKKNINEIWKAINQLNKKLVFVFNSIFTILENQKLTNNFETYNQSYKENKFNKFKNDLCEKNIDEIVSTEQINELELSFEMKNDFIEIFDCQNWKKLGELEIDVDIDQLGYSPRTLIDQQINTKNITENNEEFSSCISKILQMISKVVIPIDQKQEIKSQGAGIVEIKNESIKKISNPGWNSITRLEIPIKMGLHEISLKINHLNKDKSGFIMGFVNENDKYCQFSNIQKQCVGINMIGSKYNYGTNNHHKDWSAKDGDEIHIKLDFNQDKIEFKLNGVLIVDAKITKYGQSTLIFAIFIYQCEDEVTLLEQKRNK